MLIGLFLMPYIISRIGLVRFGIWALIGVVTDYFGLLDFGVTAASVKYIAEFYTRKEYENINRLINTNFLFYSCLALATIFISPPFLDELLKFFSVSSDVHQEAYFVFLLGIIIFVFSAALNIFAAIQLGLQRMDIANKIAIALSIPMVLGTILFLEGGYGIRGLMINNLIIFIISSAINVFVAIRLFPQLKFNPFLFDWRMFKKLFNFGIKTHISYLSYLGVFQLGKIFISHFLSICLVGFYQLGSKIVFTAQALPLLLISAVVPAASETEARDDKETLYLMHFRGSKYLALIGAPFLMFFFFVAPLVMLAWMGQGYEKSAWVIRILTPAYLFTLLTGMSTSVARGIDKPEFEMKAGILNFTLCFILSFILVIKIGLLGAALGVLIASFLSTIYFFVSFYQYLGLSTIYFTREAFFRPILGSVLIGSFIGLFNLYIHLDALKLCRWEYIFILGAEALAYASIYIIFITKTKFLDQYDKDLIRDKCITISSFLNNYRKSFLRK